MPSNALKGLAKDAGVSLEKAEKKWEEAKKQVKEQYEDVKEDSEQFYKLVTSITKNMLGIKDKQKQEGVNMSFEQKLEEEYKHLNQIIEEKTDVKENSTLQENNKVFEGAGWYIVEKENEKLINGSFEDKGDAIKEQYTNFENPSSYQVLKLDENGSVIKK